MLFWRKCCSSASLRDSRYFWLLVSDGFFRRCCCPQWISRHQWSSWHQRSSWLQQRRDPWPGHWSFDSWFSHFWFLFHWTITSLSGRSTVDIPAYSHTVQYAVMHFCTNYNAIKFPSKSESESELRIIEVMDELMGLFTRKPVQTQLELLLDQYRSLTTESKKKYHNAAHDKKNPDGSPFFSSVWEWRADWVHTVFRAPLLRPSYNVGIGMVNGGIINHHYHYHHRYWILLVRLHFVIRSMSQLHGNGSGSKPGLLSLLQWHDLWSMI